MVTLFWLWITSYAVLLGAEINAEAEQQTVRDTTKGADAPIGQRGAVKADSLPTEGGDADPKAERQQEEEVSHTSLDLRSRRTLPNRCGRPRPRRTPRSAIW